ncbi:hypothetical protein [Mucilaginibacter flavidus]|nr:hypothetical protein [Mucilaginibacter flavidus]MCO5951134.1 hypothetical protein [Mucilaginibacter flavidus]
MITLIDYPIPLMKISPEGDDCSSTEALTDDIVLISLGRELLGAFKVQE